MTLSADKNSDGPSGSADNSLSVLGIDPGLQLTGYALLSGASVRLGEAALLEAGVVRLDPSAALEKRLAELDSAIDELVVRHRPNVLACEELYAHYQHPRTAILMGHARGVILAVAGRYGIPACAIPATHAKKLLTGNGHASKEQVQRAVAAHLRIRDLPEPPDVADAIAIALAGHQSLPMGAAGMVRP